jgi:hypothetical protein
MNSHSVAKKTSITGGNQTGKRLSIDDIYKFIKQNGKTFQNIGCINLNENVSIKEDLEKLQFQDIRKVYNLPSSISNFLQVPSSGVSKYLHAGTFIRTKSSINLSLFSSVISCLRRSFLSQTVITQEKFLLAMIERLKIEISNVFLLHQYEKLYNWSKTDVMTDISTGIFSGQVLKILCDFFCVNIFVFDIDGDTVYFGGGMHYVPFRKTIFLLKFENDEFEPLFTEQTRSFTLSDDPMSYIRKNIRYAKLYPVFGYGVSKTEEVDEDLVKYNPPPKKTKKEFRIEKELVQKKKEQDELEAELEKIDEKLSETVSKELAEYDDSMNGFTEEHGQDSDNEVEQITEKKPTKKVSKIQPSKKTEWHIEDDETPIVNEDSKKLVAKNMIDSDTPQVVKPLTKIIKVTKPVNSVKPVKKQLDIDITKLKTMKLAELQETATKLTLPIREGGKALTKPLLLAKIEEAIGGMNV